MIVKIARLKFGHGAVSDNRSPFKSDTAAGVLHAQREIGLLPGDQPFIEVADLADECAPSKYSVEFSLVGNLRQVSEF